MIKTFAAKRVQILILTFVLSLYNSSIEAVCLPDLSLLSSFLCRGKLSTQDATDYTPSIYKRLHKLKKYDHSTTKLDNVNNGESELASNDFITASLNGNDVSHIRIVHPPDISSEESVIQLNIPDGFSSDELDTAQFGFIFRQCAPYIAMHRGSTMVIHISGRAMSNHEDFISVIDDISILHLLGVQLVLVAGVRQQLDNKITSLGMTPKYYNNMRITDDFTMTCLKETSGSARFEIESSLARGYRGRPGQSGISVVSGNFFYSAKPLGVRDGVDFKLTGEVRRIEVENINKRLEAGDVVMLTSLGYSPSGEVFNVPSESLAAECASKLKAAKLIYLTEGDTLMDTRTGKNVQSLRLNQVIFVYIYSSNILLLSCFF